MAAPAVHADPMDVSLDMTFLPLVLSPLPSPQQEELRAAYTRALSEIRPSALAGEPGAAADAWAFHSRQEDVDIYTRKPLGSNTDCSKGVGYVDAPPLVVATLFNSPDWRPLWDQMYSGGSKVAEVDALTGVSYSAFGAPWPVSGRDFCALGRSIILPPASISGAATPGAVASVAAHSDVGALFTFSASTVHPQCPEKKGLVRGQLHFCGLWIEAVPGKPNQSKVIYALGSDPMGSLVSEYTDTQMLSSTQLRTLCAAMDPAPRCTLCDGALLCAALYAGLRLRVHIH
jgi:hypothetical protein